MFTSTIKKQLRILLSKSTHTQKTSWMIWNIKTNTQSQHLRYSLLVGQRSSANALPFYTRNTIISTLINFRRNINFFIKKSCAQNMCKVQPKPKKMFDFLNPIIFVERYIFVLKAKFAPFL